MRPLYQPRDTTDAENDQILDESSLLSLDAKGSREAESIISMLPESGNVLDTGDSNSSLGLSDEWSKSIDTNSYANFNDLSWDVFPTVYGMENGPTIMDSNKATAQQSVPWPSQKLEELKAYRTPFLKPPVLRKMTSYRKNHLKKQKRRIQIDSFQHSDSR